METIVEVLRAVTLAARALAAAARALTELRRLRQRRP
jgi:hypothetical protein